MKNQANPGRHPITNTLGRNTTTGYYESLYSFGARSFPFAMATPGNADQHPQ